MNPRHVFLLWHSHEADGDSDAKLLGVYSDEEKATHRMRSARLLPGFAAAPDGFEIVRYEVDRDEWREGFNRLAGEDVPAWFARGHGRPDVE